MTQKYRTYLPSIGKPTPAQAYAAAVPFPSMSGIVHAMSKNKTERELTAAEERARCLRLVQDYHDKISKSFARLSQAAIAIGSIKVNGACIPTGDAMLIGEAICKSLDQICEEIRRPKSKGAGGDFSLEEIQEAFKIVDELSNPFEE
jgi:hypothetical protein